MTILSKLFGRQSGQPTRRSTSLGFELLEGRALPSASVVLAAPTFSSSAVEISAGVTVTPSVGVNAMLANIESVLEKLKVDEQATLFVGSAEPNGSAIPEKLVFTAEKDQAVSITEYEFVNNHWVPETTPAVGGSAQTTKNNPGIKWGDISLKSAQNLEKTLYTWWLNELGNAQPARSNGEKSLVIEFDSSLSSFGGTLSASIPSGHEGAEKSITIAFSETSVQPTAISPSL